MPEDEEISGEIEETEVITEVPESELSEWQKLQQLIENQNQKLMERMEALEQKLEAQKPKTETVMEVTEIPTENLAEISNLSTNQENQSKEVGVDHPKTLTRKQQRMERKAARKK